MVEWYVGHHTNEQSGRMRNRRREIYEAGNFVRLLGCHVPMKYSDEVLDAIANEGWEVACDQAPYPMLCINCTLIHKGKVCRGRMKKYYVYGGNIYERVIRNFTVLPKGLTEGTGSLIFEVAYEDDEDAGGRIYDNKTFKRWSEQHGGSDARNRGGQHHTRSF